MKNGSAGPDPGSVGRRYAAPREDVSQILGVESRVDDPRFTMLDVTAPNHVEIEIRRDGVVYVHVNGVTAFRACRIGELLVTDHRDDVAQASRVEPVADAVVAYYLPPLTSHD